MGYCPTRCGLHKKTKFNLVYVVARRNTCCFKSTGHPASCLSDWTQHNIRMWTKADDDLDSIRFRAGARILHFSSNHFGTLLSMRGHHPCFLREVCKTMKRKQTHVKIFTGLRKCWLKTLFQIFVSSWFSSSCVFLTICRPNVLIITMLFGQARSFALILPFLLGSALSAPCDLSTDISGLGEEIDFISSTTDISKIGEEIDFTVSATKLSVLGFSASVSYVTLPPGKSVVSSHTTSLLHDFPLSHCTASSSSLHYRCFCLH